MVTKAKQGLKELPGFSQGVRNSAALRDVIVAQPICPKSQIRGKMVNGNYEPPEIGPGDENCQLDEGSWWDACTERGHNPYWRTVRTYNTIDIEEIDPETGDVFVVGTKRKVREVDVLNVTSVSPDISHSSGRGLARKIRYRGFRLLSDLGVQEVCQFRSCQKPTLYHADGVGDYCSLEHLNLIAAHMEGTYLTKTDTQGLDAGLEQVTKTKRRKQLQEVMPRNVEKIA